MHFSSQEENQKSSFFILKHELEVENRRKKYQDHKEIKINRRKLPSDFFKNSVQRSLPKRSALTSYLDRLSIQRTTQVLKQPQTQRKITSYHNLPYSEIDQTYDFHLAKTDVLRFEDQNPNTLHRRLLLKQINTTFDRIPPSKLQKSTDYVKPKAGRSKQKHAKFVNESQMQNSGKNQYILQKNVLVTPEITQLKTKCMDMGCTFGKGFRREDCKSPEKKIYFKNHSSNLTKASQNDLQHLYDIKLEEMASQKKESSTQQSEFQGVKSAQPSPIQIKAGHRLFNQSDQTPHFQNPHTTRQNKINWNIYRNDIFAFQQLSIQQKSKLIFTAQQKQRRTKYRANNSSSEYREKPISSRKDKKINNNINLPKISIKGSNSE